MHEVRIYQEAARRSFRSEKQVSLRHHSKKAASFYLSVIFQAKAEEIKNRLTESLFALSFKIP